MRNLIWQYKVVEVSIPGTECRDIENTLNYFGKDNWELVSVDDGIAYFKRKIAETIQPG